MKEDKEKKNKQTKQIIVVGIIIIFIVSMFAFFVKSPTTNSKQVYNDEFAQCLVKAGAKMYGAWWCPHCLDQKDTFGTSWEILVRNGVYIECANKDKTQTQECKDAKIQGYPTWRFANGHELGGFLPYTSFVEETNCTMKGVG